MTLVEARHKSKDKSLEKSYKMAGMPNSSSKRV